MSYTLHDDASPYLSSIGHRFNSIRISYLPAANGDLKVALATACITARVNLVQPSLRIPNPWTLVGPSHHRCHIQDILRNLLAATRHSRDAVPGRTIAPERERP
ncbi:hypothetical protein PsYK624_041270 [Phanerochaete sordida]|uniref:Uncharacterized protein n=1 Tax=Phanerochaete sordida TaxID=48140 RepID=A0A9P3LAZ9_9APHY|nr:hypothetical protein PsYK624_041270 [Phanerochaete sordida]